MAVGARFDDGVNIGFGGVTVFHVTLDVPTVVSAKTRTPHMFCHGCQKHPA
jgi:hypothetical protein